MRKPRLIYENDARHHLLYRFAPPLSAHRLRQPVDELLGTGGAWVYAPLANAVYDDRHDKTTIEMYRAAATNYLAGGADGLYLDSLPWPHAHEQYQVMREMGYPEVYARKAKHYLLGPRAADPGAYAPARQLPLTLEEGIAAKVCIFVGDQLAATASWTGSNWASASSR